MKLLHTADWHLNDRLGRIDRTDDLRAAVERIAKICKDEKVDVLIVAGDLFSELARPDALRETIYHWQQVFSDFLGSGGTILTLTGNHDNENFCQTLRHAMSLAAPNITKIGDRVPPGRLYLAAEPTLLKVADRTGNFDVKFVLMPYPTPTRYLRGEAGQKYTSPGEKHRLLNTAFAEALDGLRRHTEFQGTGPSVLSAHVHVQGSQFGTSPFRMTADEDVILAADAWAAQFDYVALGHIHKPQFIGREHVRYSGSIEKMDLGERNDVKGVLLFELGPKGLVGEVKVLPLPSSPIYEVNVFDPPNDLPRLKAEFPDAQQDLVNLHIIYTAGRDHLEELLRELDAIFPRWYARDWKETGRVGPTLTIGEADRTRSFTETVNDYLSQELMGRSEEEREELLRLAKELIDQMPAT